MTPTSPLPSADVMYMRMALAEARKAFEAGEVPVGAVIVSAKGRIVGKGHNLTEALADVSAHAEMQAITAAAATIGGKYLTGCTLYVTVEPCLMCAGALGWSQISRVVFGAPDTRRGYRTLMGPNSPFHPRTTVSAGVLEDECAALLKEFFRLRR